MDWPGIKRTTGPTGEGADMVQNVSYGVGGELRARLGMQRLSSGGTAPILAMVHQRISPQDFVVFSYSNITDGARV